MPAVPWISVSRPADPAGACTIFAARLPLRSYRHMPQLLWFTVRIRAQLRHTPAILGYAFDLEMRRKTLWTMSAWTDRAGLARFDRTDPHSAARQALRAVLLPSTFVVWTCPIDRLPVPWSETRERLSKASLRTLM
jgi:hypothetical protein